MNKLKSGRARYSVLSGIAVDLERIGRTLEHMDEHHARDILSQLFDHLDERMAAEQAAQEEGAARASTTPASSTPSSPGP